MVKINKFDKKFNILYILTNKKSPPDWWTFLEK